MPYFDARSVARQPAFVAWLDALGTKSALLVSHARAVNFVMKIHAACIEARVDFGDVRVFPMNDGVYCISDTRDPLKGFMRGVLSNLADVFVKESEPKHRFMVRGAVAHGFVSYGGDLHGDNWELRNNLQYLENIILGMPLAQAVEAERLAPPFGIVVHESARMTPPTQVWSDVLWRWWDSADTRIQQLSKEVDAHLDWAERNQIASMYPLEALKRHRAAAREYFYTTS